MTFTTGAELQYAFLVEIRLGYGKRLILHTPIVERGGATTDQPPGLAIGWGEASEAEKLESRHAAGQFVAGHLGLWQFAAGAAALEDGPRGLGGGFGIFPAVAERRGLARQHLFCLIDVAALQLPDRGEIQFGEEAQKAPDVVVFSISPKLPVFVGRQPLCIEPDGALRRLAHLDA